MLSEADKVKLKKYKALRQIEIQRLGELHTAAVAAEGDESNRIIFKFRYETLDIIRDEFSKQHNFIIGLISQEDTTVFNSEDDIRASFDKHYFLIKSVYFKLFTPTNHSNSTPIQSSTNITLPKISLPIFSGDITTFSSFKDMFDAVILNNNNLSDIEKFNYLLSSLKGSALTLVQHLPMTAANFKIAYDSLVKRFKNNRLIASAHWSNIENTSKLQTDDPVALRNMLDIFEDNLCALKLVPLPVDQWDYILVQMLLKRLPLSVVTGFELHHNSSSIPTYSQVTDFLTKHCNALNNLSLSNKSEVKAKQIKYPQKVSSHLNSRPSTSLVVHAQSTATKCIFCNNDHVLYKCPDFLSKSSSARYQSAKIHKLCINCLSNSHSTKQCKSSIRCHRCNQLHHTLLHFEGDTSQFAISTTGSNQSSQTIPNSNSTPQTIPVVQTAFLTSNSSVLLSTAQIEVLDNNGTYQKLRCLLDSGSMTSFITQKSAQRLGLPKTDLTLNLNGLGSMQTHANLGGMTISFKPVSKPEPVFITDAVILPSICGNLPTVSMSACNWPHTSNIKLADPYFDRPGTIDILLGADVFSQLLLDGCIRGEIGTPDALNTALGYVLIGKTTLPIAPHVTSLCCTVGDSVSLENTVQKFWEVEQVPEAPRLSSEDSICEKIFSDSHSRDETGRYILSLPFKDSLPYFPSSRSLALHRFYSLEKRLLKEPLLHAEYSAFLREYIDLGHMSPVSPKLTPDCYYIPHHCVSKPESTTTKLRVVFDASARLPNQSSLNDHLLIGPKLQKDIVTILLNFRLHPIVLISDIKMMYRQIFISPDHQDYQRILWRFNISDPVQDFRLHTVTYGISSSPYMAIRTLHQLVADEGLSFPLASHVLLNDTYMDDIVTSIPTVEEALRLQNQLISLLKKGGFELRKWASNAISLLTHLPSSHVEMDFSSDSDPRLKILGLRWRPSSDCFYFSVQSIRLECTKRNLLSNLARIFDPLGFLSPVTFLIKHLIQRIWDLKINWDQTPPQEILRLWDKYTSDFSSLENFEFPRHISFPDELVCEIHCFGDASEKGYCAVLYFLIRPPRGENKTVFVCSKSKVAPLKRISVPKLELCAAVLATRLVSFICQVYESKINFTKICCWSDSTIVLAWLASPAHRWKTFVSNRVSFIHEKVPFENWFHVLSGDNPADVGSRGLLPSELLDCSLWWKGPSFLRDSPCIWDNPPVLPTSIEALEEERKLTLTTSVIPHPFNLLIDKYSSFTSIIRIGGFILRFIHNIRNPLNRHTGCLTTSELYSSMLMFVKQTQSIYFSHEISLIEQGHPLTKPLRKLSPFLDDKGILRVGGRLSLSHLRYDRKFPALLPSRCRLTDLIIEHFHIKYLHAGIQTVHFLISQQFWIVSAKRSIRRIIGKCIRCWKTHPNPVQPRMADLPSVRISQCKPFLHSGTDFAGPFRITMSKTRGAKTTKAYLCLFICFVTKAVHLELVSDMSSEAFLAALRRFIARRGQCQHLYSDCGTNYVGAYNQLLAFMQESASKETISWHFNPPSAPHFGGLWESGVKSVKTHLLRVVGEQILTFEELLTVFTQIEAILNSRPITPVSNDPSDLSVLTPGHFLTLAPLTAVPEPDFLDVPVNRLTRWQLLQRIHQHFWQRWSKEYLHTLHQRSKWTDESDLIKVGTLVLIKNDITPPLQWAMGRVTEVFPGADGRIRVASVKTNNGVLRRPVVKLCPLPLDSDVK